MATNLDYNVNVNATNGVQALNNLQNKVAGLNSAFGGLQNAIAGLALTSIVQNIIGFADQVKDLSDATGIATENILGFQKAVSLFGGTTEGAQKGLLRLVQNIGEAADGSASLQFAFSRIGVSIQDLATLSEQDILRKVIEGLGTVTDKSEASALKAQLLGKEFRNVDTSGEDLANTYARITAEQEKNAAAIETAAQLNDNLQQAIGSVQIALLNVLQPIADFINAMDQDKVNEFIGSLTRLIAVATGFMIFGKVVALLRAFAVALGVAQVGVISLGLNLLKNFTIIGRVITLLGGAVLALKTLFPDAAKSIGDSLGSAMDSVKEFFGFKPEDTTAVIDKNTDATKANADANEKAGQKIRNIVDPFKTLREQISGLADDYARVNKANIDNINNSTALIGKSREESEVRKAVADLAKREADEIRKLTDQKAKLTKEQQQAGLGAAIDTQIAKIKEQTAVDIEATEKAILNSERRANARKLEEFAINSQINVENQLQKIQDDIAKSTMPEIERKQYDILAAAKARAKAEIDAEQIRRGSQLTDDEKLKFYEAAKKGTDELIAKEQELYVKSREFSTGWKNAFQEYTDNATNAALAAQRIFQKTTQGMEDAIVNFAKTGKFEFKSFMNSILEDLLRSQVRQLMAQMLGGFSTASGGNNASGGLFGVVGNLLGFANGGIIPSNEPVIVGERGPELLMGASGRQVVPNEKLGASTNVTYNISAVDARSFKDMIAQDPSFIHAVAMQGGKSTPGRR
jgi:lambda family phage tail tape measure protein